MTHQPNVGEGHCACGAYPGGLCDGWCYGACGLSHWDELELRRQLAAKTAECDALKHDISRHVQTCAELATECERLRESQQEISVALGVSGCDAAEMLNVIDSMLENAERYMWLRAEAAEAFTVNVQPWEIYSGDELDAAIDAARKETP